MQNKNYKTIAFLFGLAALMAGCDRQNESISVAPELSPITTADTGHVCGMTIKNFPGPKAQAFIRHSEVPLKFCSTTDLFSWLLQPDTPAVLRAAYVHDMGAAEASWDNPSDKHYIPAKLALYVINHDLPAAMGPTLASFKEEQAAHDFIRKHGGKIVRYKDINLELLSGMVLSHSD